MNSYGESVLDFGTGDRVELHPATDAWMRGERYGTVLPANQYRFAGRVYRIEKPTSVAFREGGAVTLVKVRLDSGRVIKVAPQNLRLV